MTLKRGFEGFVGANCVRKIMAWLRELFCGRVLRAPTKTINHTRPFIQWVLAPAAE